MPVGMTVEIPGMTTDVYDRVMSNLDWGPDNLPQGFLSHHCCEMPGGVDLLIGEEELTGRGLGPEILGAFVRDVVTAPSVVAAVEEANRRSWRAFEKAGFRYVRDVEEDGIPHRLMRLDR